MKKEETEGLRASDYYPSMLATLVEQLADPMRWNWTRMSSHRDAADRVLQTMVEIGLIEGRHHPHTLSRGPSVYRIDGRIFGRTDGIDDSLFEGTTTTTIGRVQVQ